MLGGLSVKVEDVIEPELKKFLEEVLRKLGVHLAIRLVLRRP